MRTIVLALAVLLVSSAAAAAEHPALARARALYNAGSLDEAIASAGMARVDRASADAAALVQGRSYLERFRLRRMPEDLVAAREALAAVNVTVLLPRDQVDLQVGLGQALFLSDVFGAAAEMFEAILGAASPLPAKDRLLLLDWWATALDREAQRLPADRRPALYGRVVQRMESEVGVDPGSAPANYWLAVAARGAGDVERAWHAAMAGWVRAPLAPETALTLRAELDQLVTSALITERSRTRPAREQQEAAAAMRAEWESLKQQWQ